MTTQYEKFVKHAHRLGLDPDDQLHSFWEAAQGETFKSEITQEIEELQEIISETVCDLHYSNGLQEGFSMGQMGAEKTFAKAIEDRKGALRVFKESCAKLNEMQKESQNDHSSAA